MLSPLRRGNGQSNQWPCSQSSNFLKLEGARSANRWLGFFHRFLDFPPFPSPKTHRSERRGRPLSLSNPTSPWNCLGSLPNKVSLGWICPHRVSSVDHSR
ncbi:hypothetical protein NL676_023290 [Syzygium grande]|nr:hypothetical protein NL676_023290 [Syzygium grande]